MKVRDAILKGTTEAEQLELIYKLFGTPTGNVTGHYASLSYSFPLSLSDTYTHTHNTAHTLSLPLSIFFDKREVTK